MKVFVINCGSSSIKCNLYELTPESQSIDLSRFSAHVEWKNQFEDVSLDIKNDQGIHITQKLKAKSIKEVVSLLLPFLYEEKTAVISSLNEIDVIGHRIVHGGRDFIHSTRIDSGVIEKLEQLAPLAPLHNAVEIEAIKILQKLCPEVAQVAVFDTAFHHHLPKAVTVYPGPYQWYEEGIQRYGFHGISFQYCAKRVAQILGKNMQQLKIVICHLGSGASLCAIREGKSIDTTMGFTPLEGLMMDTRSGTVDPGILLYLLENTPLSVEELSKQLYEHSGLLGISGTSSDMRDVLNKKKQGDPRATLALDVYLHRLCALIGSMVVSLEGLDVLVFTAGIGENSAFIREKVCEKLSFLGIDLDLTKNESISGDTSISCASSSVQILVIHTKEAFEIARECQALFD